MTFPRDRRGEVWEITPGPTLWLVVGEPRLAAGRFMAYHLAIDLETGRQQDLYEWDDNPLEAHRQTRRVNGPDPAGPLPNS